MKKIKDLFREVMFNLSLGGVVITIFTGLFYGYTYSSDNVVVEGRSRICDPKLNFEVFDKCRRPFVDGMYEFYKENREIIIYQCRYLAQETSCKSL